jgi:hypothetical protein
LVIDYLHFEEWDWGQNYQLAPCLQLMHNVSDGIAVSLSG